MGVLESTENILVVEVTLEVNTITEPILTNTILGILESLV